MANILFGAPEEDSRYDPVHKDLLEILDEDHEVLYTGNGKEMLTELSFMRLSQQLKHAIGAREYDLIIYDTTLFYGDAPPQRRIELFESHVVGYLKNPQLPVIILADKEIDQQIKPISEKNGFLQFNYTEEVISTINQLLP